MHERPRRLVPTLLAVLAVGPLACASAGGGGGGGDRDVITLEELQTVAELNGYEAIRRLRPEWLRERTTFGPPSSTSGTPSDPMAGVERPQGASVYVDGLRQGGFEDLVALDAADIGRIEFLSSADATTRFGSNNPRGAILVTTR